MSVVIETPSPGREFDFLHGRWRVYHHKLSQRLCGSNDWIEFPGTLDVRSLLGGSGNIDVNVLDDPTGRFQATSIRVFRALPQSWSIWWVDGRRPGLDAPVVGNFNGKIGRFYGDDECNGQPIRVRFTYEDLSPSSARWNQAFSSDNGESWETNWIMEFTRETLP